MSATVVNVVHLITDLDVGGAEVALAHLVQTFDPGCVQSTVISLGDIGTVGRGIRDRGIPVYAMGMRTGHLNFAATWRLVRLLRRLKPDLLQTWLYHADLMGLIAGTLAGVPQIAWNVRCAELDPRDHPHSLPWLLRALAALSRWPAAVVSNSVAGRRVHEQLGYTPAAWSVIPNGFDMKTFRPCAAARLEVRGEVGLESTTPLVGLLARFHPMKDHATFLEAAGKVLSTRPDVRFVAAGRGVDTSPVLADLVARLGLRERMFLLPERRDPSRFLASLDVAVSASYSEAFPNVVGEAMACGVPCVVTDVGDARLLVGDTGSVVPKRDPSALAVELLRLLSLEPASRESLGLRSRQRILDEFSLQRAAARYQQLYNDLTARRRGPSSNPTCAE